MTRHRWRLTLNILKIAVSGALIFFFITYLAGSHSNISIASWSPQWFFLALAVSPISWFIAAEKWRLLIPREERYGIWRALKLTLISISYGYLLPGSQITGEVAKFAHTQGDVKNKGAITYSITFDKLFGLLALLAIGCAGSIFSTAISPNLRTLITITFVTALMVIFIAVTFRKYLFAIAKRFVPRSLVHLEIFQWKSAPFTNQLSSAILSLLYQCLICVSLSLLARSVGIHVKLIEFFWISSVTILFTAIPISYAGIGIREITLSYCLGLLGVAQTQILAFAAIFYGFMLVPTSLGLILTLQDFIKKRIRKE